MISPELERAIVYETNRAWRNGFQACLVQLQFELNCADSVEDVCAWLNRQLEPPEPEPKPKPKNGRRRKVGR